MCFPCHVPAPNQPTPPPFWCRHVNIIKLCTNKSNHGAGRWEQTARIRRHQIHMFQCVQKKTIPKAASPHPPTIPPAISQPKFNKQKSRQRGRGGRRLRRWDPLAYYITWNQIKRSCSRVLDRANAIRTRTFRYRYNNRFEHRYEQWYRHGYWQTQIQLASSLRQWPLM